MIGIKPCSATRRRGSDKADSTSCRTPTASRWRGTACLQLLKLEFPYQWLSPDFSWNMSRQSTRRRRCGSDIAPQAIAVSWRHTRRTGRREIAEADGPLTWCIHVGWYSDGSGHAASWKRDRQAGIPVRHTWCVVAPARGKLTINVLGPSDHSSHRRQGRHLESGFPSAGLGHRAYVWDRCVLLDAEHCVPGRAID